eukprot:c29018_g2_i2 orf=213-734(+)
MKILVHVTRPRISVLGNIPGTSIYRNVKQYPEACLLQGALIIRIDAAIYFSNSNYILGRITKLASGEDIQTLKTAEQRLRFIILELSPVTGIDSTGVLMFQDLHRSMKSRNIQLALANPGRVIIQKLEAGGFMESLGREWLFINVGEAIAKCSQSTYQALSDHHNSSQINNTN